MENNNLKKTTPFLLLTSGFSILNKKYGRIYLQENALNLARLYSSFDNLSYDGFILTHLSSYRAANILSRHENIDTIYKSYLETGEWCSLPTASRAAYPERDVLNFFPRVCQRSVTHGGQGRAFILAPDTFLNK